MKNYLNHLLICITILFCLIIHSCTSESNNDKIVEHDGPVPSDWFYTQRAFPHDKIDYKAHLQALRSYRMNVNNKSKNNNANWIPRGPTNVGGRVTDIEMFSDDQNTILVGSASGGIFRSFDKGASYEPIFDDAMSLSIGDIDIAKSNENTIYVGTGEANAGGGSLAYDGVGVYKSTDRGETWNHIGLEGIGSIGKVAVDPTDENTVFVAGMGRLFSNNPERGIFRTKDGGNSWEQVLSVSDSTGGIDLAVHPTNPDIIYSAMWERKRKLNDLQYGGPTSGIYKSIDGGDTWSNITDSIPTTLTLGRIGLAIAPSNPDRVYAYIARASGSNLGVYSSSDAGETWDKKSNAGIDGTSFMWWFGKIGVNPENEEEVYITALHVNKLEDGSAFWKRKFSGAHVDQHAIFIHPQNPDLVVIGNDGGVYVSEDAGDSYVKSADLPNIQFYRIEINNLRPHILAGGAQDNGTQMTTDGSNGAYDHIYGGDGFNVIINPTDDNIMYAEFQYGNIGKSTNGGINFSSAISGFEGEKNWDTPFVYDPTFPRRMYAGSDRIYRSFDAKKWVPISDILPNGPYGGGRSFGTITSISVSPKSANIIYAGTDDGNIYIGEATGRMFIGRRKYEWTKISDNLPVRWVTAVAASPIDKNTVYATLSGYRYDDGTSQVFVSRDKGLSWSDIGATLPDIPVNDIIPHPTTAGTLYIATDAGVYISEDDGTSWDILGQGLPLVPVTDIDYHEGEDFLVAGTYGRSAFQYNFSPVDPSKPSIVKNASATVYPNPSSTFIRLEHQLTGENINYSIADGQGNIVDSGIYNEQINIAHLPKLNYVVTLYDREQKIVVPFIKI